MLKRAEQVAVLTAMEALGSVDRAPALVDCVRSSLDRLIPHETFVFGAGTVKGSGFTNHKPLGYRFPLQYLEDVRQPDGSIQTPSISRWLQTGQPQLFESAAHKRFATQPWLRSFDRYDLCNMAAHGVVDRKNNSATFFSFFQISDHLGARHAHILKLLAPHLHLSLQRCASELSAPEPQVKLKLSALQREILRSLYIGKTNWEIALILGLTERNTKYHVEEIIRKLGVVNRTQAAVKAASLSLL